MNKPGNVRGKQFDGHGQQNDSEEFSQNINAAFSQDFFYPVYTFQYQVYNTHVQQDGNRNVQQTVFRPE
jgi:hypothetical protein